MIKKTLLLSCFYLMIISPAYSGYYNYYGSGRDHPYSAYIDRYYYIGPADYKPIDPIYIDGPLVISKTTAPPIQSDEFIVNIPNVRGGYNSVVIKRSGEGYIGPFGEYYPEFPKIFQLEMKYGN